MAWKPNYATRDELGSFVRIGDTADDVQLDLALAAASRAIDRATGRQFGQVNSATTRTYTAKWDTRRERWYVTIDDLMTITDLVVTYDVDDDQSFSATITNYQLRPANAAPDGEPWTELVVRPGAVLQPSALEDGVRITGLWGWLAVPDAIKEACLLQASRLVSRRDSPFGVAGSPETGSELRLLDKLDADVDVAVRPYKRVWGAA